MTKEPRSRGRSGEEEVTPPSLPKTTPAPYDQPGHDFTLQAVMEMQRTLGGLSEKIIGFGEKVDKIGDKLGSVEKAVHSVKVGAIVAGAILTVVGTILWWAIGDRVTVAVHAALGSPPAVQSAPTETPQKK